jgi:hypothetical protein
MIFPAFRARLSPLGHDYNLLKVSETTTLSLPNQRMFNTKRVILIIRGWLGRNNDEQHPPNPH